MTSWLVIVAPNVPLPDGITYVHATIGCQYGVDQIPIAGRAVFTTTWETPIGRKDVDLVLTDMAELGREDTWKHIIGTIEVAVHAVQKR